MAKKKKGTAPEIKEDFLAKEAAEEAQQAPEYTLDIPEDEIWTYQIEGLQAPRVGVKPQNVKIKKIIFVVVLLIAISASIFMSVRAVHNDEYKFKELEDGTYELVKYTNPGSAKDIVIDYYVDKDGNKDKTKPVTVISEYAFNCDEVVNSITFGKDVRAIDGKSIYSCWWITNVYVDEANPYFCDLDGVLYTKDLTEIIFYPNDHDKYRRVQEGYAEYDENGEYHSLLQEDNGDEMYELWGTTERYDEAFFEEYNQKVRTYVLPSSVTKIGQLAFAYTNVRDIYMPQGVTEIGSMAFFKNELANIYSYTTDAAITDTSYNAVAQFASQYNSLPEGLEKLGSDVFTYDRNISYMYIPSSVTEIGHHCFWDAIGKDNGNLFGITVMNVARSEEEFKDVKTGDQWRPE